MDEPKSDKQARRGRINDPEGTRSDILDVATEHFSRHGLSGARVDEIAEQTHTSKRMLYYYFGSKEGLFRAVLARSYAEIRSLERRIDHESLDPAAALRRLVELTFDYHRLHPDFVRIVMVENIHRGEHIGAVEGIETRADSVLGILRGLLDRGQAAGVFRAGLDPLDLHLSISALCFYNVSNRHTVARIFGRDPAAAAVHAARRDAIVDMVLRWALADPAAGA